MPRSWPPASRRSSWKGPARTTGLYDDSGGVGGNDQRPPPSTSSTVSSPQLLSTRHAAGAVTVIRHGALRSGWSKHAQTNRASSGSKDIHR
jgi:hypothetical protein